MLFEFYENEESYSFTGEMSETAISRIARRKAHK